MIELLSGLLRFGHWLDSADISVVLLFDGIPVLAFVIAYGLPADRDDEFFYLTKVVAGIALLLLGDWLATSIFNWMNDQLVACEHAYPGSTDACDWANPTGVFTLVTFGWAMTWSALAGVLWLAGMKSVVSFLTGFLGYLIAWVLMIGEAAVLIGRPATVLFLGLAISAVVLIASRLIRPSQQGQLDRFIPELDRLLDRL